VGAAQSATRDRLDRQGRRQRGRSRPHVWYRPRLEQLEPRIVLSFNPTGIEQELFQLVNRFRADPQGELSRLVNRLNPISSLDAYINLQLQYWGVSGAALASQWQSLSPVPPLAWSEALYDSAHDHNRAMLANDGQEHQFPGELDPGQRMHASGYDWQRWGENIYAYPRSVLETHGGFVIDWGSGTAGVQNPPNHRIRLLRREFVHIGVAIDNVGYSDARNVGPLIVTQDLATPSAATTAYIVGAVFKQKDSSPWYYAGYGYGNVHIVFAGTAGTFESTSLAAGGYQVQLPPGTYRGYASGGSLPGLLLCDEFTVGVDNVAVDFVYPVDQGLLPVAAHDAFVTDVSTARALNVLANDRDADGALIPSTLSIVTAPNAGEVQVDAATGLITYFPDGDFSGLDRFEYQIRDDDGLLSNVATVRVVVMDLDDHPWQNPVNNLDVNVDEAVTPADALQIINALNAGQGSELPVPPAPALMPPPLLDVTGDNLLSPRDALRVINYLSGSGSGEGEGETPSARGLPGLGGTAGPAVRDFSDGAVRRPAAAPTRAAPEIAVAIGLYAESNARDRTLGLDAWVQPGRARRTWRDAIETRGEEVFRDWPHELVAMWLRF
jgi:hypothetical protein